MRKVLVALAVGGTLVLGSAGSGTAQDATPPAAVACSVEPRPVDELVALWFDPQGTPLATPTPLPAHASLADLPPGEPVDAATEAAIEATMAQIFACFDADQFPRAFALMSDDAVRQFGPDLTNPDEDTADEVRANLEAQLAATPEPVPAATGWSFDQARRLEDGRVGGVFTDVAAGQAEFVVFEQRGERWLLADIAEIQPDGTPAAGTPAA